MRHYSSVGEQCVRKFCNINPCSCETWNPCARLIAFSVCMCEWKVWMECVCVCVKESVSDERVNERSALIGVPCRLRGRLIENASDTHPQPSLAQNTRSYTHAHTHTHTPLWMVSCWGHTHAELHSQTRQVMWKQIKCAYTHMPPQKPFMHKIIPGNSIFQKDTLRHFFFSRYPSMPSLKRDWKTRSFKKALVTGILSAFQHSSQGGNMWLDVPEGRKP